MSPKDILITLMVEKSGHTENEMPKPGAVAHGSLLIPTPGRRKDVALCELQANLIYTEGSRTPGWGRYMERPCLTTDTIA